MVNGEFGSGSVCRGFSVFAFDFWNFLRGWQLLFDASEEFEISF